MAAPAATGGVGVVNISNVDSTLQITGVGATTAVGSVAVNAPIQVAGNGLRHQSVQLQRQELTVLLLQDRAQQRLLVQ